jgi:hypothetical protein
MRTARSALLSIEQGACRAFNRVLGRASARRSFALASRLGDGWIWAALMIALVPTGP